MTGLLVLFYGLVSVVPILVAADRAERRVKVLRASLALFSGGVMLFSPFHSEWVLSLIVALGFATDGVVRIFIASIFRFPRWRYSASYGAAELVAALCLLLQWPLSHTGNITLGIGLFIGLSGWMMLRMGFMLRNLEEEVAILMLPIFAGRGWHDHAPILIGADPPRNIDDPPLLLHIWTPVGSANVTSRRLVIDRYVAAVDANGAISTGHAALEMAPDLYISHYPAEEIERSSDDFIQALNADPRNDVKGRFVPSLALEVADWCPPDVQLRIHRYNPRRLRAFWAGYRQSDTYNVTNRNCAVVVAAGLEAALEGALAGRYPWLRLLRLLADPDLWLAALVRGRAESMTWTPGFILDYARVLGRIVDRREAPWGRRLRGFLAALRARRAANLPSSPDDDSKVQTS
ncbi:HdeD family acid-resistance protein [Niveispirillum irakense]|uniref:HdeD family acid-resistance protein n=1 Tax=Niveispirillum irakense TaxID=34011 RepID=UPI001AEBDE58|nr:protease [Niveispirillum irakense]